MTTEEKREAMRQKCSNYKPLCTDGGGCPLYGKHPGFRWCVLDNDEYVEKFYTQLCGVETATPEAEAEPVNITLHAAVCDELKDLYHRKNTDYGDSFHKTYLEEGLAMSRIRLTDKLERFKRLTRSGEQNVKDESVRDTLIDLANYAIMTIVEMERVKND